jgi:SAM-dependent methyltransferase
VSAGDDDNRWYSTTQQADNANKLFYARFGSYPPPPREYRTLEDTGLWRDLMLQEAGDWDHARLPDGGTIWVAGCGQAQAVEVALNFPRQQVLATDLNPVALDFGRSLARGIGLTNLELREESIFDAPYEQRFDMVICRGVVHHTANPPLAVQKLARALKPDGILDLLVLNRSWEGWQMLIPFQKALRILCKSDPNNPSFDFDFKVGKDLAREMDPVMGFVSRLRKYFPQFNLSEDLEQIPDFYLGCMLSEPNMHSYTIASYAELCHGAGLELLAHGSMEPWMAAFSWDLDLKSPELRAMYEALPQLERWQMTSLLVPNQPRVIRFYSQLKSSKATIHDDRAITEQFLQRRFARVSTTAILHQRNDDPAGGIVGQRREPFPPPPRDAEAIRVLEALDESRPIGETLKQLGIEGFRPINVLRRKLTTPACPYLRAV